MKIIIKVFSFFFFFFFFLNPSFSSYEIYGISGEVEYLLVPESHIWRENPRIWTIKRYSDPTSKFIVIYSFQEGDCKNNKIRYRSQTWVLREERIGGQLLNDKKVKRWRIVDKDNFEDYLLSYLCTVRKEDEENE